MVRPMNKKKLVSKLTLGAIIVFLMFCFTPIVQAGVPPFIQELEFEDNFMYPWWTGDYDHEFEANEELHFRVGAARTIEERENDWWPKPPWRYRLYINDEEINLQRFAESYDNEFYNPAVCYRWYALFEPNYFDPDEEYVLRWEMWVKNPYQGDGLNEWRIFVDYWNIYGHGEGVAWSFEYTLNIV